MRCLPTRARGGRVVDLEVEGERRPLAAGRRARGLPQLQHGLVAVSGAADEPVTVRSATCPTGSNWRSADCCPTGGAAGAALMAARERVTALGGSFSAETPPRAAGSCAHVCPAVPALRTCGPSLARAGRPTGSCPSPSSRRPHRTAGARRHRPLGVRRRAGSGALAPDPRPADARRRPATCVAAVLIASCPPRWRFPPATFEFLLPIVLSYACGAHAAHPAGLLATVALTAAIQVHVGFSEFPNLEIAIGTLPPWWGGVEVRRRRQVVSELAARTASSRPRRRRSSALGPARAARIARDLHDIVSHHLAVMVDPGRRGAARRAVGGRRRGRALRRDPPLRRQRADRDRPARHDAAGRRERPPRLAQLLERGGDERRARSSSRRPTCAGAGDRGDRLPRRPGGAHQRDEARARGAARRPCRAGRWPADDHRPQRRGGDASSIAHTGSRLGLASMRERVAALDGSLAAGPEADGGFSLRVRLPLAPAPGLAAAS